jgi:hypothetical protein
MKTGGKALRVWTYELHGGLLNKKKECLNILYHTHTHTHTGKRRPRRKLCCSEGASFCSMSKLLTRSKITLTHKHTSANVLKQRITTALSSADRSKLRCAWNWLDYPTDICRVTKGSHLQHSELCRTNSKTCATSLI